MLKLSELILKDISRQKKNFLYINIQKYCLRLNY